ncbi:hypothetical protein M3Y97_00254500 [Aphelenchoides bicaudatus]|nr:hypothetical protein M3Y97_00254500 [Aphelenchoides bicaudatus]
MLRVFGNLLILLIFLLIPSTNSISCYECIGGKNDPLCNRYTAAACGYGLFGCVKIATYSGGVDKMGNFLDDDSSVISMIRGCNILPLGGVDACQQSIFPGLRIVTCYCYNDYCNSARLQIVH